jgi:hypothetical protein
MNIMAGIFLATGKEWLTFAVYWLKAAKNLRCWAMKLGGTSGFCADLKGNWGAVNRLVPHGIVLFFLMY